MITLQKSQQLKSIAILMMLFLHLFNRDYKGLFEPLIFIGSQPLSYYISLFSDACVPIFAFVSGYGLYFKYRQNPEGYFKGNIIRLKKLYINYWIVLLIFAVLLGWITQTEGYPGSWLKFITNLSGLDPSYNSAWWFLTTYVFFVLSSRFWFSLLDRMNPKLFSILLLIVYVIAFYFRVYWNFLTEHWTIFYIYWQSALYFCTLFQFMLGAYALKYDWNTKTAAVFSNLKFKNLTAVFGILILIIAHGLVPNFIVAPFTALGFIFLFLRIDLSRFGNKFLDYFTPHSTNLWLIHMFFYMIYFPAFVYGFKYVLPIYLVLVGLCLLSSYSVNLINKRLQKLLIG